MRRFSPEPETLSSNVGIAHDYLLVMRGAERTFAAMAEVFNDAPIYTALYDEAGTGHVFRGREVHTSRLQHLGVGQGGFRRLLPLFPSAVEALPVQEHDVVVSSSSAFAHGLHPAPGAVHVCFCHSPFRYVWHEEQRALAEAPPTLRRGLRSVLWRIRQWDRLASTRVSHYLAGSRLVQERIADYYGRDSVVVHPPVDTHRFAPGLAEDFFLTVGEIAGHKRVEVALEAAKRAGQRIKVVGTGPELDRLRGQYGDVAEFLGRVADDELAKLYARARALVVANTEEFGIAAVEAQAAGRPVLARAEGGVLETVVDGETGVLVDGSVESFAEAMREVDFDGLSPARITTNAERFSRARFKRELRAQVARAAALPATYELSSAA